MGRLTATSTPRRSRTRLFTARLAPLLPLAAALALWAESLRRVELRSMTDLGLVSVLPVDYFVALGLLTVGFFGALLGSREGHRLPAAYAVALVLVLHATPAILYGTLRYPWAWKHVGIVDYVQRHGAVDPGIDQLTAYHDWPGFFSLGALATEATGEPNALELASWAPPFFELLFLGAVLLLAGTFSRSRLVVWTTAWLFLVGNWVGQDYFAPQALAFFLYLLILAIAVRKFGRRHRPPPGPRVGLAAFVVLASAAIVSSHQLTPLVLILAIAALARLRVVVLPGLTLLLVVMTVAWIAFMAQPFLEGNLYWIVDSIGSPSGNAQETLVNLEDASAGLTFVSNVDRGLSAAIIALAAVGAVRRFRRGKVDVPVMVLAAVPGALLFATSYGGEILFRIYFFALPFVALLGARAFFPSDRAPRRLLPGVAAACACTLLLAASCIAYYGKERVHHFSGDEVRASRWLHSSAPAGSLVVSGSFDWPWAWRNYERYEYFAIDTEDAPLRRRAASRPVRTLEALMAEHRRAGAYVILTRSQEAQIDATGIMPEGTLQRMARALARDPGFEQVYKGPDAGIFRIDARPSP